MDTLLNDFEDFSLWLVSEENLAKLSSFILRVNNQAHLGINTVNYEELVKTIKIDIDSFPNSFFYAIKNRTGKIVGTMKAQKWDGKSILPIEEDFNINLTSLVHSLNYSPNEIWHIGRFAIDQQAIKKDPLLRMNRITILKILLASSLQHINTNPNNVFVAESDKKLFDKLRLLGINSMQIGKSKFYLGSETVPIFNSTQGIKAFVETHKHLCYSANNQDVYLA